MSTANRPSRRRPAQLSRNRKARLSLEALEDRCLFSVSPVLEIDDRLFEEDHILVRFKETAIVSVDAGEGLAGTTIGKELARELVPGLRIVTLPDGLTVEEAIAAYRVDPNVLYAEPDYIVRAAVIPNDTSFNSLYGMHNVGQTGGTIDADIDAPEAWDIHTGSGNFVVGVIDTGINYTHPDLAGNMWSNPGEIAGDLIDNDGNGFVDDIHGYDFFNNDNNPADDNGHGSHVAGTIGGFGNNALGVAGVNWRVKLMALKFLGAGGSGPISAAVSCLNYATSKGAKITNNSWGGGGFSTPMFNAINAARTAGNLFVAAAGNGNVNIDATPFYPASYNLDNVIAVAASDNNDNRASFSNNGANTVDIAAPGVNTLSTWLGTNYNTISGTSMASPHVAGAFALLWDLRPTWTMQQVRSQLLSTTDTLPASWATRPINNGRLNVAVALGPQTSILDNSDGAVAGYTEIGVWSNATTGYKNNHRTSGPVAGNRATWTVGGLTPGASFAVQATWMGNTANAPDVVYRLYDGAGTTPLQTVLINQQVQPSGTVYNGRPFQALATVTLTSGTLRVEMDSNTAGNTSADAVRATLTTPPVIDLNWTGGGITGPTSTTTTSTFTISRNYNISGAAVGPNFTITYHRSIDAVFGNADDVLLGSETISAPADKTVGLHPGTSPALQITVPGTFFLFAKVDGGDAIPETSESNNVAQAPAQVTVTGVAAPVIVDNGQPGYSETGPWFDWTGGFNNNFRWANPAAGSNAVWSLPGLGAGQVTVQATWVGDASHADVVYRIYDGSGTSPLASVGVNQRVEPVGPVFGGRPFQTLATVTLVTGTLRVELSSNATGYTIADAVRGAPIAPPVSDLNWTGGGITGPSSATTSTPFPISRTYNISGQAVGPNFTIGYYRSTDATFGNADDVLLGTETISAAADKTVGTHAGTSPPLQITVAGTFFLFANLDNGNTVNETNEGNNVAQAPAQVVVTGTTGVIVDNNQPGYSEIGTWFDWTSGFNNNFRWANPGTGDTAVWNLSGLAPGAFNVQATWVGDASHASNVVYRIYDGSSTTPLRTVFVDQRVEPVGEMVGGRPFQSLGTVNITGSSVRVEMDSNVSGYTIADAIRARTASFVVDQSNTLAAQQNYNTRGLAPLGQEFRPTLTTLDIVEVFLQDAGSDIGSGADFTVRIRQGTIGGTILGTSGMVHVADNFTGWVRFNLPATVAVVPESVYVIEVVNHSTDVGSLNFMWSARTTPPNPYTRGRAIIGGAPDENVDFLFREGPLS